VFRDYPFIGGSRGSFSPSSHAVAEEVPLTLNLNGRHVLTAMVSPHDYEEFVIGFLYTEQIVKGIEEIESIKRDKNVVSVLTKNPFKVIGAKKIVLSGCGGTSSFTDVRKLPRVTSTFTVGAETITAAIERLPDSELHRSTDGIYAAGLVDRTGLVRSAEDIGRHNALDKAIGSALRGGIDLSGTYAVCTGQISSEMVRKCLVANIPLLASRGSTTSLAIETARATGLAVVGFVGTGRMNIYTHPERIEGAPPMPSATDGTREG